MTEVQKVKHIISCPQCTKYSTDYSVKDVKTHLERVHKVTTMYNLSRSTGITLQRQYPDYEFVKSNSSKKKLLTLHECCACYTLLQSQELYALHFKLNHSEVQSKSDPSKATIICHPPTMQHQHQEFTDKDIIRKILPLESQEMHNMCLAAGYEMGMFIDEEGMEMAPVCTSSSGYKRLIENDLKPVPKKMKFIPTTKPQSQATITPSITSNLEAILIHSPYSNALAYDSYEEIDLRTIQDLNAPWDSDYMKLSECQLLAGCILVDEGQALLVNCVELYHRSPAIDAHYESTSNSSIPTIDTPYCDLKVMTRNEDNSIKLIIGTQISNFLVTSSIRIDTASLQPELGPSTNNFIPTKNYKIFISQNSKHMASNMKTEQKVIFRNMEETMNLKQIRSKFDRSSTYSYSRAFSPFTYNYNNTPKTVFSLTDYPGTVPQDMRTASSILKSIVMSVVKNEEWKKASLNDLVVKNKEINSCVNALLQLFHASEEIKVVNNRLLSQTLKILADVIIVSGALRDANNASLYNVKQSFLVQ